MTVELFFIGDEFYFKSGTSMSSLYGVATKERWDWGFVSVALKDGREVHIRPATAEERAWAADELTRHRAWQQAASR